MLRAKLGVSWILVCVVACGGDGFDGDGDRGVNGDGDGAGAGGGGGVGGSGPFVGSGGHFGEPGTDISERQIVAMRIEPDNAVLDVALGASAALTFKAWARLEGNPEVEVDLTEQTVFYVPDNYLVASFPEDGDNVLTTRLPEADGDPAQRGGLLTVRAQAVSRDGSVTTVTTPLTVKLSGERKPPPYTPSSTPALPDEPALAFAGEPQPALAPTLVYPNDGVLLPPNLGRLEVHFLPGSAQNTLFEVRFTSESTELVHYTRCYANPQQFEPGACALVLTGEDYELLAGSNRGQGPVTLSVRGADEAGGFGESSSFTLEFAEERIDGAVYYWTASQPPSIMRFDFGSGQSEPERFIAPGDIPPNGVSGGVTCVGCHALSRQGDKAIFGLNGPLQARLIYIDDLARPKDDPEFLTYSGAKEAADPYATLNGSFSPEGDAFVSVGPVDGEGDADAVLHFHDGETGARVQALSLTRAGGAAVIPNNPDWSPKGDQIAFTTIGGDQLFRIQFMGGGIGLIQGADGAFSPEVIDIVPAAAGKNRFNPTFWPDGSLLLYTEVDQGPYSDAHEASCEASLAATDGRFCNGYSDPGAKTWAVAPVANATRVFLARAANPGVADALYPPSQPGVSAGDLMDTFPKPSPFVNEHRGKAIGWYTVGSQRRAGLRKAFPNQSFVGDPDAQALLWMFALDAERVIAGEDGSYPGFFLPFQDLETSNHMAQWTARIVSDEPPPPAPTPPPPAPPPPPIVR